MSKTYVINEIFYSLQGEGVRAGTANVFVRFSGCNMECRAKEGPKSPGGFDCDTEFASGRKMTVEEVDKFAQKIAPECEWMILTGGEPALQVDEELCFDLHRSGYKLAIETNGSIELPYEMSAAEDACPIEEKFYNGYLGGLDWITVSPKVAEHCIRQPWANELKYVRGLGQGVPKPTCQAEHKLISPAFAGNELDREVLDWCIKLCLENPEWRLSIQQHKGWRVR